VIYLYAITEADAAVPDCRGLEDAELRLAPAREVAGLYSTHRSLEVRPQPEALWRHDQVVEAAMAAGPALPARFGTTFAAGDALTSALEREHDRLRDQLERVRGCVELAVRVGLAERAAIEPAPEGGREYVERKLARRRRQQALARETLSPLGEVAVRARHEEGRSEDEVIRASYLVRADEVDRFSERVTLLAERNPQLWLSCTGPWPPYSFAGFEEAA